MHWWQAVLIADASEGIAWGRGDVVGVSAELAGCILDGQDQYGLLYAWKLHIT